MKISDETLMAYADGELDQDTRAAVESAIAADPKVAQQVANYKAQREKLRGAFGSVLKEPVPDRLIAAARSAPTSAAAAEPNVVNLAQARADRSSKGKRSWSWKEWTAMAASVALGLFISQVMHRQSDTAMVVAQSGGLTARGVLDRALSSQLASDSAIDKPVHVAVSYRAKSGEYCRTFVTKDGSALAGAACRQDGKWRIQVLAKSETQPGAAGGYRMAGASLPQSVVQTVSAQIAGEPLDAKAEAAALDKGWH